jgi:hypothetical protein
MKITYQMKEMNKIEHHPHKKHKMYLGKPIMGENPARR